MSNFSHISDGELFADLQVSLTEIFLIELIDDDTITRNYNDRLNGNVQIRDAIKGIMKDRFSSDDIERFLESGFPRQVDLSKDLVFKEWEDV